MRLIMICFCLFSIVACTAQPGDNYVPTQLPKDTTTLWYTPDEAYRDMILISCPGGPDSILEFRSRDESRYRYLPNYDDYTVISMYQAQSFNRSMYYYEDLFTFEDAAYEVEISVEMLHRAIEYFIQRGKRVYVVGASYGAFIVQNYLKTRNPMADHYFIFSGRLDVEQEMVAENLKGNSGSYTADGLHYIPDQRPINFEDRDMDTREDVVSNLLKAAIGKYRYTEELKGMDLSDVTYVYAENDQNVGRLRTKEIQFLEKHGASVYVDDRGHTKTWQKWIDEIRAGNIKL